MIVQIDEMHTERLGEITETLPGADSTRGRTCSSTNTSTRDRAHLPTVCRGNSNGQGK